MENNPLVSVVIIFLNAEKFIQEAIESVLAQTYENWELLLVDDGSTDAGTQIAKRYAYLNHGKIHYLEHEDHQNKGMSASRNLGIVHARGEFIAFLDADDVWFPDKLNKQLAIMEKNPEVLMVVNPALYCYDDGSKNTQPMALPSGQVPTGAWLIKMLESSDNAACTSGVLMKKELALKVGGFEASFRGIFEDQAMWFKISMSAPIYYDSACVALYRMHSESCCATTPPDQEKLARVDLYSWLTEFLSHRNHSASKMKLLTLMVRSRLCNALINLEGQSQDNTQNHVINSRTNRLHKFARLTYSNRRSLGLGFSTLLMASTISGGVALALSNGIFALCRTGYNEGWFIALKLCPTYLAKRLQRMFLNPVKSGANRLLELSNVLKARLRLTARVEPLSQLWGVDRGLAIHRYYLELFLSEFAYDIRGHCLEFQDDSYTTRFGGSAVAKLDIIHIDGSNPDATVIGDLSKPNDIPDNLFDCIICTHVLHVIFELEKAVSEMYRILKPGGVLLVAAPQVSMCDPNWHEVWRFTPEGLHLVLSKAFGNEYVTIRAYGNSLTAAGEIRGLVSHEFTKAELNYNDPRFAVEVCARARKPD